MTLCVNKNLWRHYDELNEKTTYFHVMCLSILRPSLFFGTSSILAALCEVQDFLQSSSTFVSQYIHYTNLQCLKNSSDAGIRILWQWLSQRSSVLIIHAFSPLDDASLSSLFIAVKVCLLSLTCRQPVTKSCSLWGFVVQTQMSIPHFNCFLRLCFCWNFLSSNPGAVPSRLNREASEHHHKLSSSP